MAEETTATGENPVTEETTIAEEFMDNDQKKAERNRLFAMFADGKTTIGGLFEYLMDFDNHANNPNDLLRISPIYQPQGNQKQKVEKYKINIIGAKEITAEFASLDRIIHCLRYDGANFDLEKYLQLRWNNANNNESTYERNTKPITDADIFRKKHNISGTTLLTDATNMILDESKALNLLTKDVSFWENVLGNSRKPGSPSPTPGLIGDKDAMDDANNIIRKAIKDSPKKCVIFTGAPGTGKTYCVEEFVDEQMNGTKKEKKPKVFARSEYFVQFHSSYDYTDFVEGLRPIQKGDQMVFVRMDGIFKAFCRKVVALNKLDMLNKLNELNKQSGSSDNEDTKEKPPKTGEEATGKEATDGKTYYFVIDEINRADLGRVFGELMYCFEKRGKRMTTQYANLPAYGKNGDGKVVPIKKGDNSEEGFYITDRRTGAVQKIVPIKSNKDDCPEDSFYIIKDKDGNPIPIEEDCFENGFYIPDNVVIIGTMNDIDRSVETFDFALRRRFDWIEINANSVMLHSLENMKKKKVLTGEVTPELVERIKEMNKAIADKKYLGPAFAIGPAYFKGYNGKNLKEIWEHNIEPILKEYIRGRQSDDGLVEGCRKALFGEDSNPTQQPAAPSGAAASAPQSSSGTTQP